jgi:NSS family neurotransmitter:Na+ symporter
MVADRWSSGPGFLSSTVGAAVGLGNIWRFSAVLGANGGGAYLVPYVLAAFALAVPMLVLELAVGRTLRPDVVSAFRSVDVDYAALGWLVGGTHDESLAPVVAAVTLAALGAVGWLLRRRLRPRRRRRG